METQAKYYDLVVIGTGSAVSRAAFRCRAAGWSVAVIDSRPFGGTCALRGCHPKKMLVSAAETLDATTRMAGKGVRADQIAMDWAELMRFKRAEIDPAPAFFAHNFAQAGIEGVHGRAHFVGPTTLAVGNTRLAGADVLIAAGAMPAPLPFPGAEHLTTSEQFLELDALPAHLICVGGGYIAFEFAHVAARAGAQVTILHRGPRPLQHFEPELVDQLVQRTRALGVQVEVATEVYGIEKTDQGIIVHARTAGTERRFEAERRCCTNRAAGEVVP
jgi:glutathione reductase (NADPH)